MMKVTHWTLLVPILTCLVTGCGSGDPGGPPVYTVNGTVAFLGEPLSDADLLVRSVDGKHSAGTRVTDGKFSVTAPAGMAIVEITSLRDVPGEFREENPGERTPVREQFLPAKYNTQSELKLEIKPNAEAVTFELTP